jgi:hypothetical protein
MRVWLAVLATLCAALPVAAQETLSERVGEAYRIFAQNLVPGAMADGQYYDAVSAGIDGNWVLATALIPDSSDLSGLDATIVDICTRDGPGVTRIAAVAPMTITASRGNPASPVTVTFVYAGGALFASQVDPKEFLTYLGLIDDERMRLSAVNSLASSTGPVMIFRPDDDIIALVRFRGHTEIYARCPAEGGSDLDSAALATVLGAAFDEQYPKAKNPGARETFINCVVDALAPLPSREIQLLVDTNFKPEPEDMTRIGETYPAVQEATLACGSAADAALGR